MHVPVIFVSGSSVVVDDSLNARIELSVRMTNSRRHVVNVALFHFL